MPMPCRQGGYASHVRLNYKFVIKIPNNISSEHAAPLLCGGMTGLSPLLITGVGKGTRVAICGIGGIRHSSIMFAKALGAHVTGISNSDEKKQLAVDLGADHFISHDPEYAQKNVDAFDVIVHTGSFIAVSLAVTLSGLRVTVWESDVMNSWYHFMYSYMVVICGWLWKEKFEMEANGGMLGGRSFVEMDVAESVAQQAGRVDRSEARWEKRGVSENGVRMCDYLKRHTGTLWVCCGCVVGYVIGCCFCGGGLWTTLGMFDKQFYVEVTVVEFVELYLW